MVNKIEFSVNMCCFFFTSNWSMYLKIFVFIFINRRSNLLKAPARNTSNTSWNGSRKPPCSATSSISELRSCRPPLRPSPNRRASSRKLLVRSWTSRTQISTNCLTNGFREELAPPSHREMGRMESPRGTIRWLWIRRWRCGEINWEIWSINWF